MTGFFPMYSEEQTAFGAPQDRNLSADSFSDGASDSDSAPASDDVSTPPSVSDSNSDADPLIFIIAGEPSGDRIGADIIKSLKAITPFPLRFAGIGGNHMEAQGLRSLFPLKELTLMGLVEVLPHLPRLWRRYQEVLKTLKTLKPRVLLTIDAPDFCLRVAKKAHALGITTIHYTAPSVWAWRPGRAKTLARFLDHLLLLYKFEEPYFHQVNLPCTFVGHPLCVESLYLQEGPQGESEKFLMDQGFNAGNPVLCLLPGSRSGEVKTLLPLFKEALKKLRKVFPDLQYVLPVSSAVKTLVKKHLEQWDFPVVMVEGEKEKYQALKASTLALAASGTVTLELAMAQLPTVVVYKINAITAWILKRLVKVPFASLPNIISGQCVMTELLQERCSPDTIFLTLKNLLTDKGLVQHQKQALKTLKSQLILEGTSPSQRAAEVILNTLRPIQN